MSYSASNPPRELVGSIGAASKLWFYSSADSVSTVSVAGYFTDGYDRGMRNADLVFVYESTSGAWNMRSVLVSGTTVRLFYGTQTVEFSALTDAASIAIDGSLSNNFSVTLGGNRTLANPTNMKDGAYYNVWVTQDGTGSRTLAYGSKFIFPSATAPVLSTAAGSLDILTFQYRQAIDKAALVINKAFA